MPTNTPPISNDRVSKNALITAVIAAVIGTIVVLEFMGKIKHNRLKDEFPVSRYQAILIEQGEERSISRKPSNQTAQCINGYLFIKSDANEAMQGLIVDYKNRGIRCVSFAP